MKGQMKENEKGGKTPPAPATNKLLGKKDKKSKQADLADMGNTSKEGKDSEKHNDSFEKYYNKDLDLDEDQVPVVIYELHESAINFISQESFEKALILLQKAQTMLDQIDATKNPNELFVVLLIMHNMALCYQKLAILEESAVCLEQCLKVISSDFIQAYFNDPSQPSLKLKMLKYQCKTHMQICALLSQVHKHTEASYHANKAIQISHFLVHDAENLCAHFTRELTQTKPLDEVSIIGNLAHSLLEKTAVKLLPVFQLLLKRVAVQDDVLSKDGGVPLTGPIIGRTAPFASKDQYQQVKEARDQANKRFGSGLDMDMGAADMKNILGYLNQNEWIYSLNIGNIMQIAPLTLQDFMSSTAIQIELTREFVLEKMCFLAVSYFCMGTEFRFLHQLNEKLSGVSFHRKDSEYWHGKAVELAISFLPSESPLVSHILMSYEKHHSPSNISIPEDQQQDVKVRVVRQITGVDSNRLQPIIRFHPDGDFRVQMLEIEPFEYTDIFAKPVTNNLVGNQHKRQPSQSQNRVKSKNRIDSNTVQVGESSEPSTSTHQSKRLNAAMMAAAQNTKPHPLTSKTSSNKNKIQQHLNALGEGNFSGSEDENENNEDIEVEDDSFLELEDDGEIILSKGQGQGQGAGGPMQQNAHNQHRKIFSPQAAEGGGQFVKVDETRIAHSQGKQRKNQGSEGSVSGLEQIDVNLTKLNKERQRSSDLGISSKHRRLQNKTEIKQAQYDSAQNIKSPTQVDFSKEAMAGNQVFSDPEQASEQARPFSGERRARSSLSNRNVNIAKQLQGKEGKPPSGPQQVNNTSHLMQTGLNMNSTQPIGQENLRQVNKNRLLIGETMNNSGTLNDAMNQSQSRFKNRGSSLPQTTQAQDNANQKRRFKNSTIGNVGSGATEELQQIQRELAHQGRMQRAIGGSMTHSQGHNANQVVQNHSEQNQNSKQAKYNSATQLMNQAANSEVRGKQRQQASTLNVEDIGITGSSHQNIPQQQSSKKFVDINNNHKLTNQQKQQQLLINSLQKDGFERTVDVNGVSNHSRPGQLMTGHLPPNRGSQGTPQQPAKQLLMVPPQHKRKTPTGQSQKNANAKQFQQNMIGMFSTNTQAGMRESANQIAANNGSALTGEQLRFMMQREKFNQSAIIQNTNDSLNNTQNMGLNKIYAGGNQNKKTPTANQQSHGKDHMQQFLSGNIQATQKQGNGSTKSKQSASSHAMAARAASQLVPSSVSGIQQHNLLFADNQNPLMNTQALAHARKSSIDGKLQQFAPSSATAGGAPLLQAENFMRPNGQGQARGNSNRVKRRQQ